MPQAGASEFHALSPASPAPVRLRSRQIYSSKVIHIDHPHREERRRVERFVEGVYALAYGGCIRDHYPTLMSVQDDAGEIHAVVGFRLAEDGPLFLEHYLDSPIEAILAGALEGGGERRRVAEIGNLGSRSPSATIFLFKALSDHLCSLGRDIAVATVTRDLRSILGRVGVATVELARAEPTRLPDRGATWGSYYSTDPRVMAGTIRAMPAHGAAGDMHPRLHFRSVGA
jgi:hypothetical protein